MTDNDLKCPECEHPIPGTGISSALGLGTGGGEIAYQPNKEHTTCPECGVELERNVEPPVHQWRRVPSPPGPDE